LPNVIALHPTSSGIQALTEKVSDDDQHDVTFAY